MKKPNKPLEENLLNSPTFMRIFCEQLAALGDSISLEHIGGDA